MFLSLQCNDFLLLYKFSSFPIFTQSSAESLCVLCMPKAFCGLEMCAKNLRELCALCERKNSPLRVSSVFFSQIYTEEKNTQPPEASPPAPLRMERGVITEIPLYVLRMFSSPSPPNTRLIGVTSHTNYQLAPPPSPPPKGRGVITEIPL